MGYIKHHAIAVTAWDEDRIKPMHALAVAIFGVGMVTGVLVSPINSFATFFIGPDGSKEGRDESAIGDRKRDTFIELLDKDKGYYCEFYYCEDNERAEIVRHN